MQVISAECVVRQSPDDAKRAIYKCTFWSDADEKVVVDRITKLTIEGTRATLGKTTNTIPLIHLHPKAGTKCQFNESPLKGKPSYVIYCQSI